MTTEPSLHQDEQAQAFTPFHVIQLGFEFNSPVDQQQLLEPGRPKGAWKLTETEVVESL